MVLFCFFDHTHIFLPDCVEAPTLSVSGSGCGRTRLFLISGWNFRVLIVSESDFYPVDAPKHSEWRHPTEWETAAVPELCLQANGLWHNAPPQSAAALTVAAGGWKWGQHLIRAKEGFVQAAGCLTPATGNCAYWCIYPPAMYYLYQGGDVFAGFSLFVCWQAGLLKNLWMNFKEIFCRGCVCHKEGNIRIRWWFSSRSGRKPP